MDLLCPVCGEPYDIDEFHDEAKARGTTFKQLVRQFQSRGCEVIDGSHNDAKADPRIAATYDLLGDDVDGAASILEELW